MGCGTSSRVPPTALSTPLRPSRVCTSARPPPSSTALVRLDEVDAGDHGRQRLADDVRGGADATHEALHARGTCAVTADAACTNGVPCCSARSRWAARRMRAIDSALAWLAGAEPARAVASARRIGARRPSAATPSTPIPVLSTAVASRVPVRSRPAARRWGGPITSPCASPRATADPASFGGDTGRPGPPPIPALAKTATLWSHGIM